jgi:predicted enzyme related to lactoylglutathione lyase
MSESTPNSRFQPGRFSWNELMTPNAKAATDFYGQLFGWQPTPFTAPGLPADCPPYTVFKTDPADPMGAAGMMPGPDPAVPAQWVAYVIVTDADATLAKATALGAKVLAPVMEVPSVGRVALIQDPQGATIGLHEPPKPPAA